VLEVAREQAREARLGQEHLLQEERLAVRHPEAFEVHDRCADGDAQRLGDDRLRRERPRRDDAGRRVVAEVVELLALLLAVRLRPVVEAALVAAEVVAAERLAGAVEAVAAVTPVASAAVPQQFRAWK